MADESWTIKKVLDWTRERFAQRGIRSARLDAEVLLAHGLGRTRVSLYTHFDQPLGKEELAACRELIKRRLAGEPVAYLVGTQEFWSLPFRVDARVLVPRPETHHLVEVVLEHLAGRPAPRVADIGTGSGAVAVAIAHERPDAEVIAVDLSADALAVARENAERNEAEVELLQGDLLAPLAGRGPFEAIASNPPYIPEGDYDALPPEVRREPRGALLSGPDGLAAITRLIAGAPPLLSPGGLLAMEVGDGQAAEVAERLRHGGFTRAWVKRDLSGTERIVAGVTPE